MKVASNQNHRVHFELDNNEGLSIINQIQVRNFKFKQYNRTTLTAELGEYQEYTTPVTSDDTIDLRKKKSAEINEMLETKQYDKIDNSYNYLIKMPMDSVNEENVEQLKNEYDKTLIELEELKSKNIIDTYYEELEELKEVL